MTGLIGLLLIPVLNKTFVEVGWASDVLCSILASLLNLMTFLSRKLNDFWLRLGRIIFWELICLCGIYFIDIRFCPIVTIPYSSKFDGGERNFFLGFNFFADICYLSVTLKLRLMVNYFLEEELSFTLSRWIVYRDWERL